MRASFLDLRKKPGDILRALERNEPVTVSYRGRVRAVMQPVSPKARQGVPKAQDHPAFGMWADREDLPDVPAHVRKLRGGRRHGR